VHVVVGWFHTANLVDQQDAFAGSAKRSVAQRDSVVAQGSARFAQPATSGSAGGYFCGHALPGRSQPSDDAIEVEQEHVGPEDVAAGLLMRFMWDTSCT
jgi:hypothetical protein